MHLPAECDKHNTWAELKRHLFGLRTISSYTFHVHNEVSIQLRNSREMYHHMEVVECRYAHTIELFMSMFPYLCRTRFLDARVIVAACSLCGIFCVAMKSDESVTYHALS